jgi:hypothetical protein
MLSRHERRVPALQRRDAVVVAQDVQGRCVQQKVTASRRGEPKPTGGKNSEHMTVREERDVPLGSAASRDDTINPSAHLLGSFSARAAIAEKHPSGRPRVDLFGREPFVFAVIPLHQIAIDFSALAESG